jgi:hypothetical protein
MNCHKHARLACARRQDMVKQTTEDGLSAVQASNGQR